MELVSLNIDGHDVQVPHGTTVLEAARAIDIHIPTLCWFPETTPSGFCRVCVVEVEGYPNLLPACALEVRDGMIVKTQTRKVIESRRMSIEMLIAQHPMRCLTCYRNGKCDLQTLASQYGVQDARFFRREAEHDENAVSYARRDDKSPAIVYEPEMCILCGLCVEACRTMQAVDVIDFAYRGFQRTLQPAFGQSLRDVECTACGQCIQVCPVNAFHEQEDLWRVQQALHDPQVPVIGLVSPVVGVSLGEEFGQEVGMPLHEQLNAMLKTLGFERVFDVGVGADIVLIEEAYQLLKRVKSEVRLPMLSSASPAWVKYIEHFYPDQLSLLSSCKSPAQALASLVKTYYAQQSSIPPERIFIVSLTPCTAEKFERTRQELFLNGIAVVDACLTTKEVAGLLKSSVGSRILEASPQSYDAPFEAGSGAGDILCAAGGMLEGVMRTFHELYTEKRLKHVEFEHMRDTDGLHEIDVKMGQKTLHTAIVHGTGPVGQLMDAITAGKKQYHYIEIKGCPQGCLRGGGQPLPYAAETVRARSLALYESDIAKSIRRAHENPLVKKIYEKFLKKPGDTRSQKLLHTTFTQRQRYL
jgi:NADP-reducing hydrogenase subunit HndD